MSKKERKRDDKNFKKGDNLIVIQGTNRGTTEKINALTNQVFESSLITLIKLSSKESTTSNMSETAIVKFQEKFKAKKHIPKKDKKSK